MTMNTSYQVIPEKRVYLPRYSGPNRSGFCICGCSWEVHHLGVVMNPEYTKATGEAYIPQECDYFGFNETGGMKYNQDTCKWEDHCQRYKDTLEGEET